MLELLASGYPWVLLVVGVLAVFIMIFGIEGSLDAFLAMMSLGPLVMIVGAVAAVQGVLVGFGMTGPGGLPDVI